MKWIDTSKQLPSQDKEGWSRQVLTSHGFPKPSSGQTAKEILNDVESWIKDNKDVGVLPNIFERHCVSERPITVSTYKDFSNRYEEKMKDNSLYDSFIKFLSKRPTLKDYK